MPDSTSSVFRIFRGFIVLAVLIFAGIARAELVGPVVGVLDGDTIDVLVERQPVRVRLAQIDAPEKRQAFGTRSRQTLANLGSSQKTENKAR